MHLRIHMNKKYRIIIGCISIFGLNLYGLHYESTNHNYSATLPRELKKEIISFLVQGTTLKEATKDIRSLLATNKAHRELLSNVDFANSLITDISERFNIVNRHYIAELLGAQAWLAQYPYSQNVELEKEFLKAAEQGDREALTTILSKNVNVNAYDRIRRTALYYGVKSKKIEAIQELIKNGANINHPVDATGETPLMQAAFLLDRELITLFLTYGANVNARNSQGETILFSVLRALPQYISKSLINQDSFCSLKEEILFLLLQHEARARPASNVNVETLAEALITAHVFKAFSVINDIVDFIRTNEGLKWILSAYSAEDANRNTAIGTAKAIRAFLYQTRNMQQLEHEKEHKRSFRDYLG
jgi:hypothetical protein